MAGHGDARRRAIAAKGRPATLRRQTATKPAAYADLPVQVFIVGYRPEQITGGLQQGDAQARALNDEIAAAGWPPPRAGFLLVVDGQTFAVQGSAPAYDGADLIGWNLWIRGGK